MISLVFPYLLVPLLITLGFKKYMPSFEVLTLLVTGVFIFFYPFIYIRIRDYIDPPQEGPRCGNMEGVFVLVNLFFYLPITLAYQMVLNYFIFKKKKKDIL